MHTWFWWTITYNFTVLCIRTKNATENVVRVKANQKNLTVNVIFYARVFSVVWKDLKLHIFCKHGEFFFYLIDRPVSGRGSCVREGVLCPERFPVSGRGPCVREGVLCPGGGPVSGGFCVRESCIQVKESCGRGPVAGGGGVLCPGVLYLGAGGIVYNILQKISKTKW